ncbi:PREDICTED: adhesion G-protein coupled receptor D1-like [Priapulus caudatus]|uniref:Adhesion G-protein coupled receptor D1-like n=1 Tax=Priapulus caudatus TaxID=37621 RepID=A0ABM1F087_PRICU|nr:PREDICTED: adhesion G-protein coupled receptor D1-like [Priapulus caudatus]
MIQRFDGSTEVRAGTGKEGSSNSAKIRMGDGLLVSMYTRKQGTMTMTTTSPLRRDLGEAVASSMASKDTPPAAGRTSSSEVMTSQQGLLRVCLDPLRPLSQDLSVDLCYELDVPPGKKVDSINCTFLRPDDDPAKVFSTLGCVLISRTDTEVCCRCLHTTNFALLMQISDIKLSKADEVALEYLTMIGLCLSIVSLGISIGILLCLPHLRSERVFILKNLCFALLTAQILFLAGVEQVDNHDVCIAVSALLHYFFLATFFWMLCQGINVLLIVASAHKPDADAPSKTQLIVAHCVIGWATPAVIVGVSVAAKTQDYAPGNYCWLSNETGLIYAFVGPAMFVVLINTIIIVVAIVKFAGLRKHGVQYERQQQKAVAGLRAGVVLIPVMGLTWIFGLMAFSEATIAFQYLFVILNTTQGVTILIVGVIMNEEVKAEYRRVASSKIDESSGPTMMVNLRSGDMQLFKQPIDNWAE